MDQLTKKPLFNPQGDTGLLKRRVIGGNTTNLNDFNNVRYTWVKDWYRQAMNNFWIPEEISLGQDKKDYPELSHDERAAYDKILSFLVFLDSIQTANLPNIGEYITANEINLCLNIQTFQECIHSQSYSYMLDTICSPTERDSILYQWKTDEHLLRRNTFIGDCYNSFQEDKSPANFLRVLMANYILEGVYFYSGFMFFYNLSRNGKMPGSAQEILWGEYVIGDRIPGLTVQMIRDYIYYLGNLRWMGLGFGTLYEGYDTEPQNMAWVSQYSNANLVKTDFFEARSTAYAKSTALVDDL